MADEMVSLRESVLALERRNDVPPELGRVLHEITRRLDVPSGLGAAPVRRTGLGSPSRDEKIWRMACSMPKAALAELTGAIKAPFLATVAASFDTVSETVASGDLDAIVIGGDTFVQDLVYDIQVPSAYAGNPLKTLYDFFYNKTSGITAKLYVEGRPRYDVVPNYTPLCNLADFVPANWPDGWLLTRYNSLHMDFAPGSPLPFAPISVSVTFRGWQYLCEDIDALDIDEVFCRLKKCGFDCDTLRTCRKCEY